MKLTRPLFETAKANYLALAQSCVPTSEVLGWYLQAQRFAVELTEICPHWTLEVACSVISSFSPRNKWITNKAHAYQFALGKNPKGLKNNLKMANASTRLGFAALKGLKTYNFARAIAGNQNAVVIDTWMIRAAGLDSTKGVSKGNYSTLAQAVHAVAKETGWNPIATQAAIWCAIRGGHA
jgi:hypothetical protein